MDNNLTRFTLPNGLRVFIKEDQARSVAAVQLWVEVGSADESEQERGVSHLIEHMAFKGTERRGVGEIAAQIESLGGEINAYTSWDETVFHATVPADAVIEGMDIITDAVLNPLLDPDELAKEKEVVLEEILEGEERPNVKASKLLFRTAYAASPYRFPVIGYKETVENFTRELIVDFRKRWYVPENMFLLIVGGVDPNKLTPDIERLYSGLPPGGFFRKPRSAEPTQEQVRAAILRDANAREARLHVAFHAPSARGADANALDLAADILGARESSRLVRVLKKEKHLVNTIGAYAITPKASGLFVVSAALDAERIEESLAEIREEIARISSEPPTSEELQRAKVNIESEHLYSRESVEGIARNLGSFEADLGDALYEEKYLRLNAGVTESRISAVAAKYLADPNFTVTALIPDSSGSQLTEERLAAAMTSRTRVGFRAKRSAAAEDALTATLANGLRVVLRPDPSNPVLSFNCAFMGGKRFESKDSEGIINFVAQMWTKGAAGIDEIGIARRIEDMGGRLRAFSGFDSIGIAATFFSRFMNPGLELLSQVAFNPSFPEDIIQRERNFVLNQIKTEPDRPVAFAIKHFNASIFSRHPYGFSKEGRVETVSTFSRSDLEVAHAGCAAPSNMVIAGVGDMDPEKVLATLDDLFGKLPNGLAASPVVEQEPPLTTVREKLVRIPRAKAHLVMGFPACDHFRPERYALEVLNNILAGQGGRLFLQLRDKESLAYMVTSFVRFGVDPGVFALYIATEPGKVEQAMRGMRREIDLVRQGPITEAELARSINNLVGTHQISLQSSWARAESASLNTLYGLGYDYDKEYLRRISQVKAPDIINAAQQFLDPERCAIVKILPEENDQ